MTTLARRLKALEARLEQLESAQARADAPTLEERLRAAAQRVRERHAQGLPPERMSEDDARRRGREMRRQLFPWEYHK